MEIQRQRDKGKTRRRFGGNLRLEGKQSKTFVFHSDFTHSTLIARTFSSNPSKLWLRRRQKMNVLGPRLR